MRIIRDWEKLNNINERLVLNIGNFDGIHIGHQSLISKGKEYATTNQIKLAVLTFNPHPKLFFNPNDFKRITTKEEMKDIFNFLGVDLWLDLPFNYQISQLSPFNFLSKITDSLTLVNVVVGFDFKFGYKASGDVHFLKEYLIGKKINLSVHEPVKYKNNKVSSTLIRNLIKNGDMKTIRILMDRAFCLKGVVVHGMGRGRELDFPTANIKADVSKILPKTGVYAGYTTSGYNVAVNVGYKPTFSDNNITIEAHLVDYRGSNLYGEELKICLTDYIREEKKYSDISCLKKQIREDIRLVKELNPAELFTINN